MKCLLWIAGTASQREGWGEPDDALTAILDHLSPSVDKLLREYRVCSVVFTELLGFKLDLQHPPAFAQVSVGNLKLVLSGPGASGSRPMLDGKGQEPGGWNRVMLQVNDLAAIMATLKAQGVPVRNEMASGPGEKQIQLEDPDGNPLELFQPAKQ